MPELRTDWLTGRTVIVAENRAGRPNEFVHAPVSQRPTSCLFCPSHESQTPPAVYEKLDDDGRWRVRVIPNKYPAVTLDGDCPLFLSTDSTTPQPPNQEKGTVPFGAIESTSPTPAIGAHEVIIESPRHIDRTSLLSVAELRDVLEAYAARLRHWRDDDRLRYGLIFKNQGPEAGASLAHLHSQLVALPIVPPRVEAELARAADAFQQHNACPYCRLVAHERETGARIVWDRDGYVAFCPYASWQPYELWLLPAQHHASFERTAEPQSLATLAEVLHTLLERVEAVAPRIDINFTLRTAPWTPGVEPWSHWRIELLPRLASLAGIELATGVHINPLAPERAARHLASV